jgi:uncharacterized protein
MLNAHFIRTCGVAWLFVLCSSCASFYEVTHNFNSDFESGHIERAYEKLQHDRQYSKTTTKLLYYVNSGLLLSLQGKYAESNKYFEKAYLFGEDYKVNYLGEAASFLTNPMITVYRGEDHEHLMPLYYKAINFLKMAQYEEALVECRRLNIRLQQLSDKYKSPNRFQRDAFIHNLMGIIYQATNDWNNAFIAYRNACEIYEEDYQKLFGIGSPEQLKKDLLLSAWRTGFIEEFDFYKEKFEWPDFEVQQSEGELVFFWHNGLCPVKDEWSINIAVNHNNNNAMVFTSDGFPINVQYDIPDKRERADLSDLEMFRLAIPKYVERPVYNTSAYLRADTLQYPLQLAEDVNKIAFKSLYDRMTLEISKSVMRAAIKKAAERSIRKEDKGLGAAVGMVNAITEKADTRNWQTLPHSILYSRVPLKQGNNTLDFVVQSPLGSSVNSFTYVVEKGQTLFHTYTSLESQPPAR